MLNEVLYALALIPGTVYAVAMRRWQRQGMPPELRGGVKMALSALAGLCYTSLMLYPFLVWPWFVGIAAPLAAGLLAVPFFLARGWEEQARRSGALLVKPFYDLVIFVCTAFLWLRYFAVV